MKKGLWIPLLMLSGFALIHSSAEAPRIAVPLSFDYYYTYDMMAAALRALHQAYPKLTLLEEVGKSEEGRPIYCLTVNNPRTGSAREKPGIYVDGNIHGNEIQAGEVALYLLNYLLTEYGRNPEITQLVDRCCFYVVPVVNVDGRFHFFADANSSNNNRSLRIPRDDDRDGRFDEDSADDLDGDGNICQMRRRDPFGRFKTCPDDPRLLVRCKPGEKGEWKILGEEGIDNDNDGRVNEDSEGYVDGNRNWGFDWMPPYVQSGAGDYPFQAVGLKALAEFISRRPNICVGWVFHNFGGMYLRGPSVKTQEGEYPRADVAVYDYLGEQAERITPGYRYLIGWKDLYPTYGDCEQWLAMTQGAYMFTGELFIEKQEQFQSIKESQKEGLAQKPRGEDEVNDFFGDPALEIERLRFSDHLTQGELYKPWKPYKHPQYGDIEIGGWVKMSTRLPAPFMLKDLVHRNAMVIIFSAKQTPDVSLEVIDKRQVAPGLLQLRIRLINSTAIPTMSYHAQKVKLYPQDTLTVSGSAISVRAGGQVIDPDLNEVAYKEHRPEIQFLTVPGFGKVEYQFLISGSGSLVLTYASRHAGKIVKTITLD